MLWLVLVFAAGAYVAWSYRRRILDTFAGGALARSVLRRWAEARGIAVHEAKIERFGRDPFPLEETDRGVVFRARLTDADAVVRDAWIYVPHRGGAEDLRVEWIAESPAGAA